MSSLKKFGDPGGVILFALSIAAVALAFINLMSDFGFALFYCVSFVLNFLSVVWFYIAGSRTDTSKHSLIFSSVILCVMLAIHNPLNALALLIERSQ